MRLTTRSITCLAGLLLTLAPVVAVETSDIHEAVSTGQVEVVRSLVESDPTLRQSEDRSGRTPFHLAIMKPYPELWSLLATPELIEAPDSRRLTPIFLAITNQSPEALDWLIERGVDIGQEKPGDGQAPLHWAAELGRDEQVRSLLAAGAEIESTNRAGSTPLLVAAKLGSKDCAELLLEAGADSNRANVVGLTPLMIAALRDYREIVSLLLDHRADPSLRDARGKTALDYAVQKEFAETAEILRQATQ